MFKTIGITNFQAHKETNLTLDRGVNVATGTSDSGKTAIIRSINWLMNNRPSGDAFKNWSTSLKEPVSVQIELEDGTCIVLERQNGKNSYTLYDKDGDPITFSAIRSDVPKEITDLLNMAEYNVQTQHQPYFLLQDTPGEVAKKLNDLVGLSVIDTLFSNIASKIRRTSANVSSLVIRRDNLVKELVQYAKLDEVKTIIETLEKLHKETEGIESSLTSLDLKISSVQSIEDQQAELIPYTDLEPKVQSILTKIEGITSSQISVDRLSSLITSLKKIESDLEVDTEWIKIEPAYMALMNKIGEYNTVQERKNGLSIGIKNIIDTLYDCNKAQKNVKRIIKEYIDMLKEHNICPTCGADITEDCLHSIEKSMS